MGTSRVRGVFLSTVDHLIRSSPGEFSGIIKCWGRIDVQIGHFKLTYQDYRYHRFAQYPLPSEDESVKECHGENVVIDGVDLVKNSTECIHKLLGSERPPTALVVDWERIGHKVENDLLPSPVTGAKVLNALLDLPESWKGDLITIYFRSHINYPMDAPKISDQERQEIRDVFGRPVDFIDMRDISGPWWLFMEVREAQGKPHRS